MLLILASVFVVLAVPSVAREDSPALRVGLTFVGDTAMGSDPSNINTALERDLGFSPEEVAGHVPKEFHLVIYEAFNHDHVKSNTSCQVIPKKESASMVEWYFKDTPSYIYGPDINTVYSDYARLYCPQDSGSDGQFPEIDTDETPEGIIKNASV